MSKYWKIFSTIMLSTFLTAACGSDEIDKKGLGNDQTGYETPIKNDSIIINDEEVSVDLNISDGNYTFTLKNISDKDIDLTFSSSQAYEYQIKDIDGNVVYTYSMDKVFSQMIVEKTITAGESNEINVDVDIFSTLEKGTYRLEIWSMALESENLSSKVDIIIEEVGSNLEGEYVGKIDNNSVEIIDSKGNPNAYRLTSSTREFISSIEPEEHVSYNYYKQNGQLFLTMINALSYL